MIIVYRCIALHTNQQHLLFQNLRHSQLSAIPSWKNKPKHFTVHFIIDMVINTNIKGHVTVIVKDAVKCQSLNKTGSEEGLIGPEARQMVQS